MMVFSPKAISKMANRQKIIPSPITGMNNGCSWFLNELCITTGPKNIRGNAQPMYFSPFTSIFLSVAITPYCFPYVFMFV